MGEKSHLLTEQSVKNLYTDRFCFAADAYSCFSDGARDQGFPPGGHKRLLFLIIRRLIYKSGIDGA